MGEARARAARLTADAETVQAALHAVARQAGAMHWAGPVREAFDEVLRARLGELSRAAEALRSEADRLVREALHCEPGQTEALSGEARRSRAPGWSG